MLCRKDRIRVILPKVEQKGWRNRVHVTLPTLHPINHLSYRLNWPLSGSFVWKSRVKIFQPCVKWHFEVSPFFRKLSLSWSFRVFPTRTIPILVVEKKILRLFGKTNQAQGTNEHKTYLSTNDLSDVSFIYEVITSPSEKWKEQRGHRKVRERRNRIHNQTSSHWMIN